jgi:predicted Zn-dependent protease
VGHANDAAITAGRRAVELDSGSTAARFMLGAVYVQAGRLPDAVRELEAATRVDPNSVQALGLLGYAYAKSGKPADAQRIGRDLESSIGKLSGAAAAAARVALGLGNNSHALDLLERAVGNHDSFFSSESLAESFFDPVRSDPRFATIVARTGLDSRLTTR